MATTRIHLGLRLLSKPDHHVLFSTIFRNNDMYTLAKSRNELTNQGKADSQNFTVERCSPLITSMLVAGATGGGAAIT
jgi:hypothetical protein